MFPVLDQPLTGAQLIAAFLVRRGVQRVFGLCGGHIQPIWDELAQAGVQIVDVRHECAAVYMAHAHSVLTKETGVALVTAGPGLTNTITGIANAATARVPVLLISGRPPLSQHGMGALQDIDQAAIVSSLCRLTSTVSHPRQILSRLHATMQAAAGVDGPAGPAYVDFSADLLRMQVPQAYVHRGFFSPPARSTRIPSEDAINHAVSLLAEATRVLIISGRGAQGAEAPMRTWLDRGDTVYLDTAESKGIVPRTHPASVPGARARAMREADLVVTVGRRLDFQLAYGSSAAFSPAARFLRIAATSDELADNRRGDVELLGEVSDIIDRLTQRKEGPMQPDTEWLQSLREQHRHRTEQLRREMRAPRSAVDDGLHPYQLITKVNDLLDDESIVVADGGDSLSFARVGLAAETYLDPGPLGCLGVGVPFAISAALAYPQRRVLAVIGDGSFGFTAMEVDTAVRFGARVVFVVVNNGAWGIERTDQLDTYDGRLVGVELPGCRYDRLAEALGAYGEHVEDIETLPDALSRALEHAPSVIDVRVSVAVRSPDQANGLAIVPDLHALKAWDEAERLLLQPLGQH